LAHLQWSRCRVQYPDHCLWVRVFCLCGLRLQGLLQ